MIFKTTHALVACTLLTICACDGAVLSSDQHHQPDSGSGVFDSATDANCAVADSASDVSSEIADSSDPEPILIQDGGTSPDVSPPLTATVHAIGSGWHRSPRYWKLNLANNTQESIVLGTGEVGAHSIALLGGKAYILASDGNMWVVDNGVVSLIDLVSKAGSKLVPLGVHADQTTIHVLCRQEENLNQIDHFFGHDAEFQHSSTSVNGKAYLGASAFSDGKLYLAGFWPTDVAYAVLEGNTWVTHSMMADPGLRGIYGMTVVGDTVHVAGDLNSGVAAYFRSESGGVSAMKKLLLPLGGTITTDVTVDGDSVYLGGAKSSCPDFVETRPVYFRLDKNGTVATFLEAQDGYETWINAIRVRNKTVIVGGSDNNLPIIWIDYDADGINIQRIDLEKSSTNELTVLGLELEE